MRNFLVLVLSVFTITVSAQEFSFNLYFEDAVGNKDTLIIGYDSAATDSIDASFGEVNIINQSWDSVFEARISPLTQYSGPLANYTPAFQLKKQIIQFNPQPPYNPYSSAQYSNPIYIEVFSSTGNNFSLNWNKLAFADSSRLRSAIFYIDGIGLPNYMNYQDSLIFNNWWAADSSYYLSNNDTIWLLGFSYFSYTEVGINNIKNKDEKAKIFPNPSSDFINIKFNDVQTKTNTFAIYSLLGNLIKQGSITALSEEYRINIQDLKSGVYFVRLESDGEIIYNSKFIKH